MILDPGFEGCPKFESSFCNLLFIYLFKNPYKILFSLFDYLRLKIYMKKSD